MGKEHWVETSLGEIAKWQSGGTPTATNPDYYHGDIPWLIIGDLNDGEIFDSAKKITSSGLENSSAKWVPLESVLIAMYGSIGKLGINKIECTTNQAIAFTQSIYGGIPKEFIFNFLKYSRESLLGLGKGGAQSNISLTVLNAYSFPIPPLNEQKRIVEKLDAILPKVKNAKARLENIPLILKKFRQSVLSAACSGRLTEDWREGKDLPEWEETSIRNIAVSMSTGPFGSMLHSYDYIESGIPVINPTHIAADQIIPNNSITLSREKADELSRYKLKRNDILLARRGDLSKCGIVAEKEVNWIAGTGLFILRTHVNPLFFKYIFGTDDVQNLLNNNSIGSTMLNLNQTILGNIEIPLPPLEEQQEIVRRVEKLFALADSLEAKYKKVIQQVEKIEQSILVKAFKGELTDPDPTDEPASELLKRILDEKAKLESTKKSRSKRSATPLQH
jgi:type I restriction enzyme, S subunit